jgi:uncharacterized protein (DUF305 family)
MTRLVRLLAISALAGALLIPTVRTTAAQDASPSPEAQITASQVCNQAVRPATPVAGSIELPAEASFDLAFIDVMVTHHQRAIDMATIALERGEHPEIIEFAQHTIDVQQGQIEQLSIWRELWYPGVPELSGEQSIAIFDQVSAGNPGRGGVPGAREITTPPDIMGLCGSNPGEFDLAFIERMSLHHSGAILLSQAAVTIAEHAEIQNFAATQLSALQTDVDALYAWRLLWFPDATPADID